MINGNGTTFNEHLKSYCEDLGIRGAKDKSSHVIRFTVASVLYLKGMPLTDIQRLMGHTSLSMTMHYLRQILPEKNTAELYLEQAKFRVAAGCDGFKSLDGRVCTYRNVGYKLSDSVTDLYYDYLD